MASRRPSPSPAPPAAAGSDAEVSPVSALARALVERAVVRRDAADGDASHGAAEGALAAARATWRQAGTALGGIGALVDTLSLSPLEAELLALLLQVELDEHLQQLLVHLHQDRDRARVELGTLQLLFPDEPDAALAVSADAPLRAAALVDLVPNEPWSRQQVRLVPPVVWALMGDAAADPDLPPEMRLLEPRWRNEPGSAWDLVVFGKDRVRNREAIMAASVAPRFLVGPPPETPAGWSALVREATLAGAGPILEVNGSWPASGRSVVERAAHLPWAVSSTRSIPIAELPRRAWVEVEAAPVLVSDDEWAAALGPTSHRHPLTAEQLELVARVLPSVGGDVDAAVRRLVSGRLEELARRIRPSHGWDDLVLPPGHRQQLRELVARYEMSDRVYGEWGFPAVPSRGLVALFSGPSGTGKTLAAEVIANELGLDLFKLELSSVVSKYIGETEKHLDELFDAAGAGNLVLFFDEADALFGKRSDVQDAHDRYANLETSYLLQRLEAYDGIVIMATNYEENIDEAFLRRIHVRVDFAQPSEVEREAIWRHHLSHGAPVEGVDFPELARRFDLSGGSIRNAAVHAAFLAVEDEGVISMRHVVRGIAREHRKLGRLLRREDFGEHFEAVASELQRS